MNSISDDNESTDRSDDQSLAESSLEEEYFDITNYMPNLPQKSNIMKYIVCQIVNRVHKEPRKYISVLPEDMKKYEAIVLSSLERVREENYSKKKIHRDYGDVLKTLSIYCPFQLIMHQVISEIKEQFENKQYGKIKHIEEYEYAINKIYKASRNFMHV